MSLYLKLDLSGSVFINPRRACAARVTVVVLSVRPSSLCTFYSRTTGYETAMSDTNSFSATRERKIMCSGDMA